MYTMDQDQGQDPPLYTSYDGEVMCTRCYRVVRGLPMCIKCHEWKEKGEKVDERSHVFSGI